MVMKESKSRMSPTKKELADRFEGPFGESLGENVSMLVWSGNGDHFNIALLNVITEK